nr:MAG TPA: hypothetical protein [Caudoviricetes sp.]
MIKIQHLIILYSLIIFNLSVLQMILDLDCII